MTSVLIGIGTFVLMITALVLIALVLMQRAKSDTGMAAMGGGMMESAFGPDSSNVLVRGTIRATVVFFVVALLLYLGYVHQRSQAAAPKSALPNLAAPATPPAAPATATPTPAPAVAVPAAPDAAKTSTAGGTPPSKP